LSSFLMDDLQRKIRNEFRLVIIHQPELFILLKKKDIPISGVIGANSSPGNQVAQHGLQDAAIPVIIHLHRGVH
jgi:hypothetical protein